jgi:dTDP-4-dehydrorhamnose 3,5-epimerase
MRFTETGVSGAYLVQPQRHGDDRGFFARMWCRDEFAEHGLNGEFVQCNTSYSARAGTLRGLHFQIAPDEEAKLIGCVRGAIYDVILDLRESSPTYLRWIGVHLTPADATMLYVPGGCAHGYLTLEDDAQVVYPVTAAYRATSERGVRWNDPLFDIKWPMAPTAISPKDRDWPDYTA